MRNRKSLSKQAGRIKMNIVVRTLATGDSFVWFGWFLFNSIVAIHIAERLGNNAIPVIAIGSAIYLGTRGVLQIPFSMYMDSNRSYHDEIYAMLLGGIIMSFSYLGYEFVNSIGSIYAINVLFGIGTAIYLPAWRKTFARYVDKGNEGQNYAISDMFLTVAGALASVSGGVLVALTGSFSYVFLVASLFTLIGGLSMLTLLNDTR